jgi:hypothetical protein
MYATAGQLFHGEDDAGVLLYGGRPTPSDTSRRVTGVVPRLERRLADRWRPQSIEDLEGFLWSRLRWEHKHYLQILAGLHPWQSLSNEILDVVRDPEADGAESVERSNVAAEERQARAAQVQAVRDALDRKPKLRGLLDALTDEIAASEEADEDVTAPGWRKSVLRRTGARLGLSQSSLHQNLKRIRDVWEQVAPT